MRRLRETPEFGDATCVAIACPACMTLGLAQSCSSYVTTVINGTDMVPTMSLGAPAAGGRQVVVGVAQTGVGKAGHTLCMLYRRPAATRLPALCGLRKAVEEELDGAMYALRTWCARGLALKM